MAIYLLLPFNKKYRPTLDRHAAGWLCTFMNKAQNPKSKVRYAECTSDEVVKSKNVFSVFAPVIGSVYPRSWTGLCFLNSIRVFSQSRVSPL